MGSKYLAWAWKYRLWAVLAALVIIAIIATRPMYWLGSIGFVWVMFWLVLSVGMLVTCVLSLKTKTRVKSFSVGLLVGLLIVGTVVASVLLYQSVPNLTASEAKTIVNDYLSRHSYLARAVSAEYRGGGGWRVRLIVTKEEVKGLMYVDYNEDTGHYDWAPRKSEQAPTTTPTSQGLSEELKRKLGIK